MKKQKQKSGENGVLPLPQRCSMEQEKKRFSYGRQIFVFFRNLIYGAIIAALAFFIGLVFMPDKILNAIEIIKNLF
jgi:hypothetical protein